MGERKGQEEIPRQAKQILMWGLTVGVIVTRSRAHFPCKVRGLMRRRGGFEAPIDVVFQQLAARGYAAVHSAVVTLRRSQS